jgi:hypothetical protein
MKLEGTRPTTLNEFLLLKASEHEDIPLLVAILAAGVSKLQATRD